MQLDEEKFSGAILQIKNNIQNMDEDDCQTFAELLEILAGIVCPELLEGDFSAKEIAQQFNFDKLKGQIDILGNKERDESKRILVACTCANLAMPMDKKMHPICRTCHP